MKCDAVYLDSWNATPLVPDNKVEMLYDLPVYPNTINIYKKMIKWDGGGWADIIEQDHWVPKSVQFSLKETFLSPENLQKLIDEYPEVMAIKLQKGLSRIRKVKGYETLRFGSEDLDDSAEDLAGLSDLGF
jgi:hypothetical protein